jgi:hypothetical protein
VRNLLVRDQHAIQQLKAQSAKEFEHHATANRLFDTMMKHGGLWDVIEMM